MAPYYTCMLLMSVIGLIYADCEVLINEVQTAQECQSNKNLFIELKAQCGGSSALPKLQGLMVVGIGPSTSNSLEIQFTANLWNSVWKNPPFFVIGGAAIDGFKRDLYLGSKMVYNSDWPKYPQKTVPRTDCKCANAVLLVRAHAMDLSVFKRSNLKPTLKLHALLILTLRKVIIDMVVFDTGDACSRCSVLEDINPKFKTKRYILKASSVPTNQLQSLNRCGESEIPFDSLTFKYGLPSPASANDCHSTETIIELFPEQETLFDVSSTTECEAVAGSSQIGSEQEPLMCPLLSEEISEHESALDTLQQRKRKWHIDANFEWESTDHFDKSWVQTIVKHQRGSLPHQVLSKSETVQSWFQFHFNRECPAESTYSCRLCSKYYDQLKLPAHMKPAVANERGVLHRNYENNRRDIANHYSSTAHVTVKHHLIQEYLKGLEDHKLEAQRAIEEKHPELKSTARMIRTVYAEVRMNMPFNNHRTLVELQAANDAKMGKSHRTTATARTMVGFLSEEFHQRLVAALKLLKKPMSVILDSSTDLSKNHFLIVYFQTLEHNRPVIYFYKLIQIGVDETATGLLQSLVEALTTDNLLTPLKEWLVGYAADGASTMMGHRSGLGVQLEALVGRKLFKIHCVSHRLHLAIRHALDASSFKGFESYVNSLYRFYTRGHKRLAHLKQTAEDLEEFFYTLTYIHEIRWIASEHSALRKLQQNWHIIAIDLKSMSTSELVSSEVRRKAEYLLNTFVSTEFLLKLNLLLDLLEPLKDFSKVIQTRGSSIVGTHEMKEKLVDSIRNMRSEYGQNVEHLLSSSSCIEMFPCSMEQFLLGPSKIKDVYLSHPNFDFENLRQGTIDVMLENLKKYFPDVELAFFDVFLPSMLPNSDTLISEYGQRQVEYLFQYFEIPSANSKTEWNELLKSIRSSPVGCSAQTTSPEIFWSHVLRSQIEIPVNMKRLIETILVLPVGSSECERGFSILSHIRSARRARMTGATLDEALRLRLNGPRDILQFNPTPYALKWVSSGHKLTDDKQPEEETDSNMAEKRYLPESTLF